MGPFSKEFFAETHNALARLVEAFEHHDYHLVPDMLLFQLALDVLEQGRAVGTLMRAGVGRPAYSNTRSAFESARDMLVMVSVPEEYGTMGARARAQEVLDVSRLNERQRKADTALGLDRKMTAKSPQEMIESDAAAWDAVAPGQGDLLRQAVKDVTRLRPGGHWSGLNSAQLRTRIATLSKDQAGVAEMIDTFYGIQSMQSHPGARLSLRDMSQQPDGSLIVEPREVDLVVPYGLASMTAQLAAIALTRRPTPS